MMYEFCFIGKDQIFIRIRFMVIVAEFFCYIINNLKLGMKCKFDILKVDFYA